MADGTFMAATYSAGDGVVHQLKSLTPAPSSFSLKSITGLLIKAHKTNTGVIWLGHDVNVAANAGFPLDPGDIAAYDLINPEGKIFVLQTVGADKFSVSVIKP